MFKVTLGDFAILRKQGYSISEAREVVMSAHAGDEFAINLINIARQAEAVAA